MKWSIVYLLLSGYLSSADPVCPSSTKYYVDCEQTRSVSAATLFCQIHQMTLVNLTNGTATLTNDLALLNTTFIAQNCSGYFWFSSGNQTGLVIGTNVLGQLLLGLQGVLNAVLCLIPFLCPVATTPTPIANAFTVCARPSQDRVVQKCLMQSTRSDIQQYRFVEMTLLAGILNTVPSRSSATCCGICASTDNCVGTLFRNDSCTLYM